MRTIMTLPLAAALAAGCMTEAEVPLEADAEVYQTTLDEATAGRTAGQPVSCVRQRDLRNSRAVGPTTIVFDGPGSVVYVNETRSECPRIRPWDAIRFRTISTNICEGELIRVFDPNTPIERGGCTLGAFTPYRRDR